MLEANAMGRWMIERDYRELKFELGLSANCTQSMSATCCRQGARTAGGCRRLLFWSHLMRAQLMRAQQPR